MMVSLLLAITIVSFQLFVFVWPGFAVNCLICCLYILAIKIKFNSICIANVQFVNTVKCIIDILVLKAMERRFKFFPDLCSELLSCVVSSMMLKIGELFKEMGTFDGI